MRTITTSLALMSLAGMAHADDATPSPTTPPPVAPNGDMAGDGFMFGPLVTPLNSLEIHGGVPIFLVQEGDGVNNTTTENIEFISAGASYGVIPHLELGGDFAINLHPSDSHDIFIELHAAYEVLPASGPLSLGVVGALGIENDRGSNEMGGTSSTTDFTLQAGAWLRYAITRQLALFTGRTPGPYAIAGFSSLILPPIRQQLAIGLSSGSPISLDLPVALWFQANSQLAVGLSTDIAQLGISNSNNDLIFKDGIPIALGVNFAAIEQVDRRASTSSTISRTPSDFYAFVFKAGSTASSSRATARGVKIALIACVVLGCGGGAKPAPAKPVAVAPQPPPKPVEVVQAPARLRGAARAFVAEHGVAQDPQGEAGARRRLAAEAEVIAACLDDQWTADTIGCTTTRAAPSSCLGQLSEYQEQSFRAHISDWETNWTKGADRKVDDPPPPPPEDDATPGDLRKPAKEPAQEEWISCRESLGEIASYEPKLAATLVDRDYALAVRQAALYRSCEFRWPNSAKKCFGATHDAAGIAACRSTLDVQDKNAVTNAIGDADAKYAQVEALKKNPKAIECKVVANAHYTDEVFRGKLGSIDPIERKRVFAESRQAMATACAKEKWSPTTRACVAMAHPSEYDIEECFGSDETRMTFALRRARAGRVLQVGHRGVRRARRGLVKKVAACTKYDDRMKDMILGSYSMRLGMWLESGGRSRLDVIKQCKETQQYFEQDARERGCTI